MSPGESNAHHELKEALGANGCAVCRLVTKTGRSFLDALLYESVNDPEVQEGFRGSLGLCNRHAYRMLDMGDGLGTSILYRVVVQEEIRRLSEAPETSKKTPSALSHLLGSVSTGKTLLPEPGSGCMACRAEERAEERYLRELLEGAADGSLRASLGGPGAVCVRHLSHASALDGDGLPRTLVDATLAALEDLEADLGEFVRHSDYRFKDEPWGKERDAWRRAVERTVGRRGG